MEKVAVFIYFYFIFYLVAIFTYRFGLPKATGVILVINVKTILYKT